MILSLVLFVLLTTLKLPKKNIRKPSFYHLGSKIAKIIRAFILYFIVMFITFSVFAILFCIDEFVDPSITIDVITHQWLSYYEYTDLYLTSQDSFQLPTMLYSKGKGILPHNTFNTTRSLSGAISSNSGTGGDSS